MKASRSSVQRASFVSTDSDQSRRAVVRAIDEVIRELERASSSHWKFSDGSSMQSQLETLRADMEALRTVALAGDPPDRNRVLGILRWVIDWIPDLEDPLVKAVARVDDAVN